MVYRVGFYIFDGMEELDFVGPWEVFGMANEMAAAKFTPPLPQPFELVSVGHSGNGVRCAHGLKLTPDITFLQSTGFDILVIPGGVGTRVLMKDPSVCEWICRMAAGAQWVCSVCTGALLLCAAGPGRGRTVTTHHAAIEELRALNAAASVLEDVRFVQDERLVTSAGVSAGIDMALWLVGTLIDPPFSLLVQRAMQYEPAPPFAACARP